MRKQFLLGMIMSWAFFLVEVPGQSFEIGLSGGIAGYSGDLSKNGFGFYTENASPAVGLFVRSSLFDWFSARIAYTYGRVEAEDAFPSRGLNFRTNISELTLGLELHPWTFGKGMTRSIPYLTTGVSYFTFNPQGRDGNDWIDLRPLGTEGQQLPDGPEPYSLRQFNLPVGAGIKFNVDEKVIIGIEWLSRKLFTDYFDDVSDNLVNYQELLEISGPLSARMSNPNYDPEKNSGSTYRRGGPYDDWYHTLSFSLAFPIGQERGGGKKHSPKNTDCYRFH